MEVSRIFSLHHAKKLLRSLEICVLLLLLTWTSLRLPFAARISGEYLRRLVTVVVSHLFVFLLGNAIVLTLFFKSRGLFLQHDCRAAVDFCREFVDASCAAAGKCPPLPEEVVYEDKRTIVEVRKVRVHRRSQSERFGRECGKELRRSETERRRRVGEAAAAEVVVDKLSNEEFQRAIEEFIAKQVKFHQEEKLAIVVHGCN